MKAEQVIQRLTQLCKKEPEVGTFAIEAIKKQIADDCEYAEWGNGKCLGFSVSRYDDELREKCKNCEKQQSYEDWRDED